MKTTPQLTQRGSPGNTGSTRKDKSFPLMDYFFQTTIDAKPSARATAPATKSQAFHKLSGEFLAGENRRDYIAEFSAFTVISVISAWPIISSIIAVIRMVRNL